jgi:tetratricopeptide (TPR) repeat protein
MPAIRPIAPTLLLAVALAVAGVAHAQTTAPAAPTVTPAPNCEKPSDAPGSGSSEIGKSAAEQKRTKWQAGMKTYMECLKKFVEDQQAQSSTHAKAANAAVEEYNKAIKMYNEAIQAAPPQ